MNILMIVSHIIFISDFCIQFAEEQPAPNGNLIGHCGGPSTLSGCGVNMLGDPDEEELPKKYNVIGFDQVLRSSCCLLCVCDCCCLF